MRQFYVTRTGV